MPRPPTTKVKSERHAELGRASIADRPRDERGRLLPRSSEAPASPVKRIHAGDADPAPPPGVEPPATADPTPARPRRRLPWDRA